MSIIILNEEEKGLCNNLANDIDQQNEYGLQSPSGTWYANTAVPVPNYRKVMPLGTSTHTSALNGIRAGFAALIRYLNPLAYSVLTTSVNPSINISDTNTTIITLNYPYDLSVSRKVQITANFTAYTNIALTGIQFWLTINNTNNTNASRFFFSQASNIQTISQSWVVTLPASSIAIDLKAVRYTGTGTITLADNNSAGITLIG